MKKAKAYNDALAPHILPDSFIKAENQKSEDKSYTSALNLAGDGIMGIVEIPKIDVKLPIYHTTSEEVLSKAAGHLEGSSLPVGVKIRMQLSLHIGGCQVQHYLLIWIKLKRETTFWSMFE